MKSKRNDRTINMNWFLFFTIISLFWIILEYLGFFRTCRMCLRKSESFVQGYLTLPKADDTNKTIVILLCDNPRQLQSSFNSLLDGTRSVDEIVIYTREEDVSCFANLSKFAKVKKIPCLKTSIILKDVLSRFPERDTNLIFVGSKIHSPDLVEELVSTSKSFPNKAITVGWNCDLSSGILIQPKFISTKVMETDDCLKKFLLVEERMI